MVTRLIYFGAMILCCGIAIRGRLETRSSSDFSTEDVGQSVIVRYQDLEESQ